MKKFNPSIDEQHITAEEIRQYRKGKLTPARMHAVEKHTLACPLCAEALEGYEATQTTVRPDLRIKTETEDKRIAYRQLAAVLLLLIIVGSVYFIVDGITEKGRPIAANQQEERVNEARESAPIADKTEEKKNDKEAASIQEDKQTPPSAPPEAAEAEYVAGNALAERDVEEEPVVAEEEAMLSESVSIPTESVEEELEIALAEPESTGQDFDNALSGKVAAVPAEPEAQPIADAFARSRSKAMISSPTRTVKGKVVSAADGEPLPGVSVQIEGSKKGVMTDFDGEYEIEVPENSAALTYSFVGFEQLRYPLRDTTTLVLARLEEDVKALSEVVVSGYKEGGQEKEATFVAPQPVEGRKAYRAYIRQNMRYPNEAVEQAIEGTVKLKVTIGPGGTPEQIEVIRSLGHGLDEEAIRLVKEGPAWLPARKNGNPVEDTITLKIKFELP